jgi:AcrR family transcriptional regulator
MDRRQQKTRVAIFKAFSTLLETKRYSNITVQAIIDEANIGRSTFYGHFDTKDELLKVMCTDIFSHVFSDELMSEKTHDFSGGNQGLEVKLTHILHLCKIVKRTLWGFYPAKAGHSLWGILRNTLQRCSPNT